MLGGCFRLVESSSEESLRFNQRHSEKRTVIKYRWRDTHLRKYFRGRLRALGYDSSVSVRGFNMRPVLYRYPGKCTLVKRNMIRSARSYMNDRSTTGNKVAALTALYCVEQQIRYRHIQPVRTRLHPVVQRVTILGLFSREHRARYFCWHGFECWMIEGCTMHCMTLVFWRQPR